MNIADGLETINEPTPAEQLAAELTVTGKEEIRARIKKDVDDYLAAGGTITELELVPVDNYMDSELSDTAEEAAPITGDSAFWANFNNPKPFDM